MTKKQVTSKMVVQFCWDCQPNEVGNLVATIELTPEEYKGLTGLEI